MASSPLLRAVIFCRGNVRDCSPPVSLAGHRINRQQWLACARDTYAAAFTVPPSPAAAAAAAEAWAVPLYVPWWGREHGETFAVRLAAGDVVINMAVGGFPHVTYGAVNAALVCSVPAPLSVRPYSLLRPVGELGALARWRHPAAGLTAARYAARGWSYIPLLLPEYPTSFHIYVEGRDEVERDNLAKANPGIRVHKGIADARKWLPGHQGGDTVLLLHARYMDDIVDSRELRRIPIEVSETMSADGTVTSIRPRPAKVSAAPANTDPWHFTARQPRDDPVTPVINIAAEVVVTAADWPDVLAASATAEAPEAVAVDTAAAAAAAADLGSGDTTGGGGGGAAAEKVGEPGEAEEDAPAPTSTGEE